MHPAVGLQPPVLGPSSCLVQRALAHAQHARSLLAPWLRHERNRCNQRWDAWAWAWAWRLGGLGLGFPGERWSSEAFIANMDGIPKGPDHQTLLARPSKNRTCSEPGPHDKWLQRLKVDVPNRILGTLPAVETCIMFAPSKSLFDFVWKFGEQTHSIHWFIIVLDIKTGHLLGQNLPFWISKRPWYNHQVTSTCPVHHVGHRFWFPHLQTQLG